MAICHWLNYVSISSRASVLEEGSIRYPLTEFLERQYNADVTLEKPIKIFKRRRSDFFYEIPTNNREHSLSGYIELKYVSGRTRNKKEMQLFFNDLLRLAYASTNNHRNYFIVCGGSYDFVSNFEVIRTTPKKGIEPKSSREKKDGKPQGKYSEWFPFRKDETVIIPLQGEFYDAFVDEYKPEETIPAPEIEMVAKYPNDTKTMKCAVAIWHVRQTSKERT